MARHPATMFLSLFAAVMIVSATEVPAEETPTLYPPEELDNLGGNVAEAEGVAVAALTTAPATAEPVASAAAQFLASTTSSVAAIFDDSFHDTLTVPTTSLMATLQTTASTIPPPVETVTSTIALTPAPTTPPVTTSSTISTISTTTGQNLPPAPEFLLAEVAVAITGLKFSALTAPEQSTLSRLYAESIATTLNIDPMWVRNMSEYPGRVSLTAGQEGQITDAGHFKTDVKARRLEDGSWATQINAFYQTPAGIFEECKQKLEIDPDELEQQLYENTKTGLGSDSLEDRDDVLKKPLSILTSVKDLPLMRTWTTSTATTTISGSSTTPTSGRIPSTSTTTVITTTTTAPTGSSFPWWGWLLGVLLCCLLAGAAFFAYKKFASPPKTQKRSTSVAPRIPESPAADNIPLVQKPVDPPKPPEPPRMAAPAAPSYTPTVLTAPPVYMSAMPTTNVMPVQTVQTAQPVQMVQRAMPMQPVQAAPIATYTAAPAPVPTYAAPAAGPSVAQAAALFDQLDVNHDGVITRAEMQRILGQ